MPLTPDQVARALSDPEYRASLSDAERAELPDHPAGAAGLSEDALDAVAGGTAGSDTVLGSTCDVSTWQCCPDHPDHSD